MTEFLSTRGNHLVDPGLHVWHYEVAAYLFLGGLVAGVMVLSGVLLLRREGTEEGRSTALSLLPWTAPILLSVGMFFLWLDLENPWNAFRFYLVFRPTSVMSWGAWILLAIYPASILLAWRTTPLVLRRAVHEQAGRFGPRAQAALEALDCWIQGNGKRIAVLNVLFGAGLGVYTGLLLGTMAARPLWNSAILGPLFLTSGLSTGAAFMLLSRLKDSERLLLGRIDMGLIAGELLLIGIWLVGLSTGGAASREAAALFFGGPYTAAFWTMVVALGLLAPLVGEFIESRHHLLPGRLTAVLVLVGGFALRWILVYAGQHSDWMSQVALH
jgi:formate-dependent nitrite reductase membrane component NrfD